MTRPKVSRWLLPLVLCLLSPAASASAVWLGGDLTTLGYGLHAGVGVLPLPLVGTLGVEVGLERGWGVSNTAYDLGASLSDLHLPLTRLDAYLGAGLHFENTTTTYLEGGLRTPLVGPVGVRLGLRLYPAASQFRAGIGLEVRF